MLETTIISWPQSGRTWLITMIGKVFADYENNYDLATKFSNYGFGKDMNIDPKKVNLHTFPREHEDQSWTKTPLEIQTDKSFLNDMYWKGNTIPSNAVNMIFLVRNPWDTIISNYNRRLKIKNQKTNFRGTIAEFIHSDKGSLKTMIQWLNVWAKNFNKCNDHILIRYEDLHENCAKELRRVIDFIGYSKIPDKYIQNAVEFSQIENMRKIEQTEGNKHHTMFSQKMKFVGEGNTNKNKDCFTNEDKSFISNYLTILNPVYGY